MLYKHNELIIICKFCGKRKKVRSRREINSNGNFCSQECFKLWLQKNVIPKEIKRRRHNEYQKNRFREKLKDPIFREKWNKRQNEYFWNKRNSGDYQEWKFKKIGKHLIKILRKYYKKRLKQDKIRKRTYTCIHCGNTFYDEHNKKKRIYCSRKCRANADKIYKNKAEGKRAYRLRHPEKKLNGNGGITKETFNKIKAQYGYRCGRCGRTEPFIDQYWIWLTQDHIISRKNGGKKQSKGNIQPLCWNCNVIEKREQNMYYPPRLLLI